MSLKMSMPPVLTDEHFSNALSLHGQQIPVVRSYGKPLGKTVDTVFSNTQKYDYSEALPSITPSSRNSSAKSISGSPSNRNLAFVSRHDLTQKYSIKANFLFNADHGIVSEDLFRFCSAPEPKTHEDNCNNQNKNVGHRFEDISRLKPFCSEQSAELSTKSCVPSSQSLDNSESEGTEAKPIQVRKKKKKLKRSARKSRLTKSSKRRKSLQVENVYSNASFVKQTTELAQIEVYCRPIQVSVSDIKPKKPSVDYMHHVSNKAPSAPKIIRSRLNDNPNKLERIKNYVAQLPEKENPDPPEYLRENRLMIKKFHEQQSSVYSQKLTSSKQTTLISASTECIIFRPQAGLKPASHLSYARQTIVSTQADTTVHKHVKIFQSDRQSEDITELGHDVPRAPTSTPAEGMFQGVQFIPCMSDIRSQRTLKMRLDVMQKIEKQKKEKIKDEKQRLEKVNEKEKMKEQRRRQRREIYALNKFMTQFENQNFRTFCQNNGIVPTA